MVRNYHIDGVYIDDSALDRITLRRARKIIDRYRPEGRMDLHSWNHFNQWAGYTNCLNLYMDLLPYFDLVWIGEGRDYDRLPDHWLIEVSGIPFGLPGQMLQDGGNPWRGMVYGITNRAGWSGDPTEIWKFWDEYQISEKRLIGYWDDDCPAKTGRIDVKATVYQGEGISLVSIASWAEPAVEIALDLDWEALGIEEEKARIYAPAIPDFQEQSSFLPGEKISVEPGKGWLLIVK
jgi:hypothetical protein